MSSREKQADVKQCEENKNLMIPFFCELTYEAEKQCEASLHLTHVHVRRRESYTHACDLIDRAEKK